MTKREGKSMVCRGFSAAPTVLARSQWSEKILEYWNYGIVNFELGHELTYISLSHF
jgi:hypothetical protein